MMQICEKAKSLVQFGVGIGCIVVALAILTLMWFLRMDLREMDDNYGGY
jgi:hypothetical protein